MSEGVVSVRAMEPDELPREKFTRRGAAACSDADLLAILMGTGSADESVLDLAEHILADCGHSLANLQRMSLGQLTRYKGVGPVKAMVIKAAAELTQRRIDESFDKRKPLLTSGDIFQYIEHTRHMSDLSHEEIYAIYTNNAYRVIRCELIGRGGLMDVSADIRLILRGAVMADATALAICHNHPSGNVRPSTQDNRLTADLNLACQTMDIKLMDHIIVGGVKSYYSYSDEGKLL